ncbi:unnamed protein product [Psylliodes chrysocephalus]|uniref:Uncharacterized protein n=1 Tax=Psylliodes chrysocephalus TaxID=3402493 RepID=A0A9P0CZM7_9CUCU|nr:unnamed protein product [Psylliodes chrysocephala]
MFRFLCILMCLLFTNTRGEIVDKRIILRVRQGIEKTIQYIDNLYNRVNEDCLFAVVLSTAIMADAYRNGTHIMDPSTLKIVDKLTDVLKKSIPYIHSDRQWIVDNMLIPYMWRQDIKYKYNDFKVSRIKNYSVMNKIRNYHNDPFFTNIDFCFEDLLNISSLLLSKTCLVNGKCLDIYNRNDDSSFGYITTHKLLLLQVAKHRNCLMDNNIYERNVKRLCSQIYSDVFHEDYYDELDGLFDLFVEQVALCGYEGYTDFLSNKWLLYILKSQRSTGCFAGNLTDDLKTKIKRTSNIFEDGCADHTTGIALTVLSLYYNFIVKEIFI